MHSPDHFPQGSGFLRSMLRHQSFKPNNPEQFFPEPPHYEETWTRNEPINVPVQNMRPMNPSIPFHAPRPKNFEMPPNNRSPNFQDGNKMRPEGRPMAPIPYRFENRMNHEGFEPNRPPPPVQNWRIHQERSVTIQEIDPRGRHVPRTKHPGIKTSELSHRFRSSTIGKRKHTFPKHSSPRSVNLFPSPQRPEKKISAKDRLTLPASRSKKASTYPLFNSSKKNDFHVRSSLQHDPRIKPDCNNEMPAIEAQQFESNAASNTNYLGRPIVKQYFSAAKSPTRSQYFDEEDSSHKQETTTDVHNNFDVPLPPKPNSPEKTVTIESSKEQDDKIEVNVNDSFWDETDEYTSIQMLENFETTLVSSPDTKNIIITKKVTPQASNSKLPVDRELTKNNQNSISNFFDDEINSNPSQNHLSNPLYSNNNPTMKRHTQSHHKNAMKQRRKAKITDQNLKKYKRGELTNEDRKLHLKKSPRKINPHSHSHHHLSSKYNHNKQRHPNVISHSNSPLIKLRTHTHIRLKKTVNLADHESEHSSSEEECSDLIETSKLAVPLPNSPLQPLEELTSVFTGIPHTQTSTDISLNSTGLINFSPIESQNVNATRDETDIALAVEVEGNACAFLDTANTAESKHVHEVIERNQKSISDCSEIGLQIEYVDDDAISKPSHFNVTDNSKVMASSPTVTRVEYKPTSPKSEIETPDSVFTPGFNSSIFTIESHSHDSQIQSIDFSDISCSSAQCDKEVKYTGKGKSYISNSLRKSTRRNKQNTNNSDSQGRPESDHSLNSTREVCIPITKLDMSQYGGKVKANSDIPDNLAPKEDHIVKAISQWKCMFCHRGANENNLGYLYGPYFKTGENLRLTPGPSTARKRAAKQQDDTEMWVHAACALWSPGVCLVAFHLDGLIEAYDTSKHSTCAECGNSGATLFCQQQGCTNMYHYMCAEAIDCRLNHDCFQLLCPLHVTQRINS